MLLSTSATSFGVDAACSLAAALIRPAPLATDPTARCCAGRPPGGALGEAVVVAVVARGRPAALGCNRFLMLSSTPSGTCASWSDSPGVS